jgi:hypothetical protein
MALIMNDLEMNVALSTSEMADLNGGFYRRLPEYRLPIGHASADAFADAVGVRGANSWTSTIAQVGVGFAGASSESHSEAF